ncbi:Gfo/Idh/MocA family oxidoreductase [Xanthobacter dioxanivorans]|uniref:Gfo/Idh/MocA family oxidoreductase n=1 Tax=Xanthobacter dioxanivorans TaxID=2528964 RepID=A0A974SGA4_9HYPH|nr:Gfo/Idh/MocA family oxidoreductase [Xanthobacter dioxanivorans]QRG04540.1 Gfo/Idh/MocA family oxidoreductase [Xanthobacter dioxanivorans]
MSEPLRVGLIGAGWVTQHHLKGWRAQGDAARVVAIADPSPEHAAERAAAFAIPAVFTSAQAMLAAGGIDAVDIAAPRAVHADLARLAADHGLPILCQKPLAPTLAEAERLVADIGGRVRLMVHENWRFRAYYRQAADWIRSGAIGQVKAAALTLVTSGTVPDADGHLWALERQPFMRTEARMLVAEVLIHHLDTLRMLLGPLKVEAAALSRTCPDMRGEDGAVIHLRTADGAGVAVFASFAAHGAPAQQVDRLVVLGDAGAVRLDGVDLSLSGRRDERLAFDPDATYLGSYAATIAHFVDGLRTGAPFETAPEDNLETLRLVEDCYRISGFETARRDAA